MGIVHDVIDEQQAVVSGLVHWQKYWRDIARYVLPQTEAFDFLWRTSPSTAVAAVSTLSVPSAAERAKDVYDMTPLWGVERMTAGLLSLKTPEANTWHDLELVNDYDDSFELPHEERLALERLRNFLFKHRARPKSGFWTAHKAALRSTCAFGDGWMVVSEVLGGDVPWRYEFVPLPEMAPTVDATGNPNGNYRTFSLTAAQLAGRFGADKVGDKALRYANDPKTRNERFVVLHGVRERTDGHGKPGVRGAKFESHYILPDEKHLIGESGYHEFPFIRYAWSDSGARAQCEGPVAIALGEVKALQEMSKQELMAGAMSLRPPLGVAGRNYQRLNFNPGQTNPGLISPEGRPMFAALNTGARPDFARAIITARQENLKEMLYIPLWQALLQDREQTATEALLRAQEKGEILGPVGIALNKGLAALVDREIGIAGRQGAFLEGSPLALPETLDGAEVAPTFTSPLDRLRRMGELTAMQRLAGFAGELAAVTQRPEITQRLDTESMLELAQEILGAPAKSLVDAAEFAETQGDRNQMNQLAAMLEQLRAGGEAAGAVGQGAQALAAGAQASDAVQKGIPLSTQGVR